MKIIIPARLGSKGFPFKNRHLFKYTADSIPSRLSDEVWVTSDDEEVLKMASQYGFNRIERPGHLAEDETSIKDVLSHALESIPHGPNEEIIMLYLTYPQRTWNDVLQAYYFYTGYCQENSNGAASLLCKKEVKSHPYLCMFEDDLRGRQVVEHNLYRRQDYPKCFEISHFISIFKSNRLSELNKNLYSESTVFYQIGDPVDVDYLTDLKGIQ
jgi:CMP-N-acetylneuraminic acid synthetase